MLPVLVAVLLGDSIQREGKRCTGGFTKRFGQTLEFFGGGCRGYPFPGLWQTGALVVESCEISDRNKRRLVKDPKQ